MITLITTSTTPGKKEGININTIKVYYGAHKKEFAKRIGNTILGLTTISEKFSDEDVREMVEYLIKMRVVFDDEGELTFNKAIEKLSPSLSEDTLKLISKYFKQVAKTKDTSSESYGDLSMLEELAILDISSEIEKQCILKQIMISDTVLNDIVELLVPLVVDDRGVDADYYLNIKMIVKEIFDKLEAHNEVTYLTVARALERLKGKDEARTIAIGRLKFLQMKQTSGKEL